MSLSDLPDEKLVCLYLRKRLDSTWRELQGRYEARVRGLCFARLGGMGLPYTEVQGVVMEVFINVYKGLKTFRSDAPLENWIIRIATNTCSAYRRRFAVDKTVPLNDSVEDQKSENAIDKIIDGEEKRGLTECIAELPDDLNQLADLYYFWSKSAPEIEAITGTPTRTVSYKLAKARQMLRDCFSRKGLM